MNTKYKILLVDDDEMFRKSFQELLMGCGYETYVARNGNEAIVILHLIPVDMVVTDIVMPGKDGMEIIKTIQMLWPAMKIIAVSGGGICAPELYLDMAVKLGATTAIPKPFTPDQLIGAMENILASRPMPPVVLNELETPSPDEPDGIKILSA
jgi:DNA-binding NtrC family response regulator